MLDMRQVKVIMSVIAKDAEMKLADMKETIGGFKFLTPARNRKIYDFWKS